MSKGITVEFEQGQIEGHAVSYPVLLDADGEPCTDQANEFLKWYAQQPSLQKEAIKFAQKWLTASANMLRLNRNLDILPAGIFNAHMGVRVAAQQTRREYGIATISSCADLSKRADHLPSFDEMQRMLHCSISGDRRVHANPLAALQTGVEVCITHTTGIRGQLLRTAKFEHLWPREYPVLASGCGIRAVVMHNVRGDKTHIVGDGTHTGIILTLAQTDPRTN